ncbi:fimbrillin family protein [Bacteroides congonensis]
MNRLLDFKNFVIVFACVIATITAFTACTDDKVDDNRLPDGKYPMTFTTGMEGLAVTRAATADGSWTDGDRVAVKVGGEVKEYTPTRVNGKSAMLVSDTPFYWHASNETKTVTAWYYGTGYQEVLASSWSVQPDQNSNSGAGYQESDFLYAPEKVFDFGTAMSGSANLPFYHQTAHVVINIKNAEAATNAGDIQSVLIGNGSLALSSEYTIPTGDGKIGTWTIGSGATMGNIIPKETPAGGNNLKSYTALVIPQNMSDKRFLTIVVNGVTYYYTPKDNDANLEGGKRYTYDITVKEKELSVAVNPSLAWEPDGETMTGDGTEVTTFNVKIPMVPDLNITTAGLSSNGSTYTVNADASFSITYTVPLGEEKKGFSVKNGVCDVSWQPLEAGKYQFTYSNLRSDIELVYDDYDYNIYANVGDYYNVDGSVSSAYISGKSIGVVFKKGIGSGDDPQYYDGKLKNSVIHGYVVALQDASSGKLTQWSAEAVSNVLIGASTNLYDFKGYGNTQRIKEKDGGQLENNYPPVYDCEVYNETVPAPSSSSGWYLPSFAQLKAVYEIKDLIKEKLENAKGSYFHENDYWSSTEKEANKVYNIYWGNGNYYDNKKYNTGNTDKYVRAVLTF